MTDKVTMTPKLFRKPLPWFVLGGLVTAVLLLLYLAPEEATLGAGIRSVYVHVALTWTGMIGFVLAGLLGLVVLIIPHETMAGWLPRLGWVAFAFYLAGIATSAVASRVNWGNIFWQEPRMTAALNSLAVALILLIAAEWTPWRRVRGVLYALIPGLIGWLTYRAPLVLHPGNPIFSSDATAIQATFIGMFLLSAAIAAWILWRLTSRE